MSSALVANLIVQVGRRVRRGTELEDAMRHTVAQYWQSIDPDTVRAAESDAWELMNEIAREESGDDRDIRAVSDRDELISLLRSAQQRARGTD